MAGAVAFSLLWCAQCQAPPEQWDAVKISGPGVGQGRVVLIVQCHGERIEIPVALPETLTVSSPTGGRPGF